MTLNKKEVIKQIKNELLTGEILQVYTSKEKMNLWLDTTGKFVFFRCHGQSAVKYTLKDLTWLINNILKAKRQNINFYKEHKND